MSFFISDAMAQASGAPPDGGWLGMLFPLGLIVILYFLMIRPQMKRQKEHKKLIEGLNKGDEVITMGGVAGRIVELGETFVALEVADNVRMKVRRSAIEVLLPKGQLKEL
jgi:preprotein translocase subunit YajC